MQEVYIKISELGKFTESLFKEKLGYNNVDIISILDLIGTIEDLCGEIERLEEEIKDLKDTEEPVMEYSDWMAING